MDNLIDPFKVYVRIRPLLDRELIQIEEEETKKGKSIPKLIITSEEDKVVLLKDPNNPELYGKNIKSFPFDRVFTEKDTNKDIFEHIIKKLVDNILKGYNSTALAYGVTGAGKTYTMLGEMNQSNPNDKGISLYAVDYLFNQLTSEKEKVFTTKISYLELYNEQVIDLLTTKPSSEGIMIVEDPNKGVLVPDLTEIVVKNSNQVMHYIMKGNARRIKGSTGQNQFSSRSHAILQINIEQCSNNIEKEEILTSKMLLVDLAGSEKGTKERGIRREEGSNINKSLLALGNCINILSDKTKKGAFVPYRDSKLTRLLKDSLGGNISTIMIACVSPFALTYEETHSTLKYASRANKIEKKITRNYKEIEQCTAQYREMISSLRSEISRLKEIIHKQNKRIKMKGNKDDEQKGSSYGDLISSKHDEIGTYDDFINFNEENNTLDNSETPSKEMSNENDINAIIINFNSEVYDNILKKDLNSMSDSELGNLEKKLDSLYYDKITLEEKIKKGTKDTEINEKYSQIKGFYEKFIDVLNGQLVKNTEQTMLTKFELKSLLNCEEINESNVSSRLLEIKDRLFQESEIGKNREEYKRLIRERKDYEADNKQNKEQRTKLKVILEKNLKIKAFLKKLMIKFISNTQVKEIKDLQVMFTSLSNDKRELEIKTKKYHECFNSIVKENEVSSQELFTLSNELAKTKLLISSQDVKILDLEAKIAEMAILKKKKEKAQSPFAKSLIYVKNRHLDEGSNSPRGMMNSDKKSTHSSHNSKNHYRSTSERDVQALQQNGKSNHSLLLNKKRNNLLLLSNQTTNMSNRMNINFSSKVPTITAFIQGEEIYSHDSTLSNAISNLKYNLAAANKTTKMVNMSPLKSLSMRDAKFSDSSLKSKINKLITQSTSIGNMNNMGVQRNVKRIQDSHSLSNLHKKTGSKDDYKKTSEFNIENENVQKQFQPCISPTKKIPFGLVTEPSINRNNKWSTRCQKRRGGSHSSNNEDFSSSCKNDNYAMNTSEMINNNNINVEENDKKNETNEKGKHIKNKMSNIK